MPLTLSRQESASTTTVLFIDDNPDDLAVWAEGLETCPSHYSVLKATSEQAALVLFKDQHVDCVVLDLDLPQSSGFELLFQFVPDRDHPRIAVIILTRLRNPALHQMTLDNGAQAYLVKTGTSPQDLDRAIQQALAAVASKHA